MILVITVSMVVVMTINNVNTLDVDVVASNRGADCDSKWLFRSNKWLTTILLDVEAINDEQCSKQWQQWRS